MSTPEVIETVETEVLVEQELQVSVLETQATPELLVETVQAVDVIDATEPTQVLEIVDRGPPGPRGAQGVAGPGGPPGLPGESNVGGLEVYLTDPQPGDVLTLDPTNTWTNQRDFVYDGGNF